MTEEDDEIGSLPIERATPVLSGAKTRSKGVQGKNVDETLIGKRERRKQGQNKKATSSHKVKNEERKQQNRGTPEGKTRRISEAAGALLTLDAMVVVTDQRCEAVPTGP